MTAWSDMEAPSALFRVSRWQHEGRSRAQYWFICPGCEEAHAIGDSWEFNGDFERPTFSPSFLTWLPANPKASREPFVSGLRCHSYIREGKIEFLNDCTHALAGKTVDIPAFDVRLV